MTVEMMEPYGVKFYSRSPYGMLLGGLGFPTAEQQIIAALAAQQFSSMTITAAAEKAERDKFYRSCSQGWLNAMLDIEIGAL